MNLNIFGESMNLDDHKKKLARARVVMSSSMFEGHAEVQVALDAYFSIIEELEDRENYVAVHGLLNEWKRLREARDFLKADELRTRIVALGGNAALRGEWFLRRAILA